MHLECYMPKMLFWPQKNCQKIVIIIGEILLSSKFNALNTISMVFEEKTNYLQDIMLIQV